MTPEDKLTIVQVVGYLLICDGLLQDEESQFLRDLMSDLELTGTLRSKAMGSINVDAPIDDLLATLSRPALERLAELVEAAAASDGDVDDAEQRVIDKVQALLNA